MTSTIIVLDAILGAVALYLLRKWLQTQAIAPLPPGPRQFPLIGSLLEWPSKKVWETYTKWGEQYGGLVYCNLAGQPVIVVNDARLAQEILDGKGAIYSDRPMMRMAGELVGMKHAITLQQYNDDLKLMRSVFAKSIGTRKGLEGFVHTEEEETAKFLRRVIDEPHRLVPHIKKLTGAIILSITYGYPVEEGDDPMILLVDKFMDNFSQTSLPGAFAVDTIPALDMLPDWFPGTKYRQIAAEMRQTCTETLEKPWEYVKQQLACGTARPSFAASMQEQERMSSSETHLMKWTAATMYAGASDTTVSAIMTFFLAMTLHPEIQERAQAELDTVLGLGCLPAFSDRSRLPYVDALVKEILRWGSVVPAGVPHRLREDDVHAGFLIPKGSIIIPNIWKFCHDSATYPDPLVFRPERFLATPNHVPEPDPAQYVFGYGRRICPGILLADSSLWLVCAMSLAALQIRRPVDTNGKEIVPEVEYVGDLITHPKEFVCDIKPRSVQIERTVREAADTSK